MLDEEHGSGEINPDVDIHEFVGLLKTNVYKSIPLQDFSGHNLVYMENVAQVRMNAVKLLLIPQDSDDNYGVKAMEDEIASTLTIENIDFSRDSVRKILRGYAPADESENHIYGLKQGLEFISQPSNAITEKSIHTLYDVAIGQYLPDNDKLKPGAFYRHDMVYIVGQKLMHTGLPLPLWYLRQQGYSSALFVPFSSYVERSRKGYYNAFTLTEENAKISSVIDVTPFLVYFIENVYNKLNRALPQTNTIEIFHRALGDGKITEKEKDLWNFVLSAYGNDEFSTKQLERDFGNAAYATIRGFVLKFRRLGLLSAHKYGNKIKYSLPMK